MEFVKTPSFWFPHVSHAACTNFSLRTIELRPSKSREILHFPFFLFLRFFSPFLLFPSLFLQTPLLYEFFSFLCSFLSFCFSLFLFLISFFSFSLYEFFSFPFVLLFPFSFPFCFPFSLPISHLIFLLEVLLLFGALLTVWVKGGNFLFISSCQLVWPLFLLNFLLFLIPLL